MEEGEIVADEVSATTYDGIAPVPLHTTEGTDIYSLCSYMLEQSDTFWFRQYSCLSCQTVQKVVQNQKVSYTDLLLQCSAYKWRRQGVLKGTNRQQSTLKWLHANLKQKTATRCKSCSGDLVNEIKFKEMPQFLRFKVDDVLPAWTFMLTFDDCQYRLCGFIYYQDDHFTSRIVSSSQQVWYNDALKHGNLYQLEGHLDSMNSAKLADSPDGHGLILVFYVLV